MSVCLSVYICMCVCTVCPSAWNSDPSGRISMKFNDDEFSEGLSRKFQVSLTYDKNNGCCTWRHSYIFIFHWILCRMRKVSDKSCRKIRTHILRSVTFFSLETRAICEVMWKNISDPGQATDYSIIRRMRFSCWRPKATKTHWEYVIRFVFPLQQWLHEHTSVLTLYVRCLPCYNGWLLQRAF